MQNSYRQSLLVFWREVFQFKSWMHAIVDIYHCHNLKKYPRKKSFRVDVLYLDLYFYI